MDINLRQGRVKFQSSPSIQICFVLFNYFMKIQVLIFFSSLQLIIYNQYIDDPRKLFIIY